MSSEKQAVEYLSKAFMLVSEDSIDQLVAMRSSFLQGLPWQDSDRKDKTADRAEQFEALVALRSRFWQLDHETLTTQLQSLSESKFADISVAAARLLRVASYRAQYASLARDESIHPAFRQVITSIAVAPTSEANRLREMHSSFIRPNHNNAYKHAHHVIRTATESIRNRYPAVYEIDKAWFCELYYYQPSWDLPDEAGDQHLGIAILVILGVSLFIGVGIVKSIFGMNP